MGYSFLGVLALIIVINVSIMAGFSVWSLRRKLVLRKLKKAMEARIAEFEAK